MCDEVVVVDVIGEIVDKGVYKFIVELVELVLKVFELDFGGV